MKPSFRKIDMARVTGIKARNIQYYTDLGIVIPGVANPQGQGTVRRYSQNNVFEFLLAKKLSSYGLKLKVIKKVMDRMRSSGVNLQSLGAGRSATTYLLVCDSGEGFSGDAFLLDGNEDGHLWFVAAGADAIVINLSRFVKMEQEIGGKKYSRSNVNKAAAIKTGRDMQRLLMIRTDLYADQVYGHVVELAKTTPFSIRENLNECYHAAKDGLPMPWENG